MKLSDMLSDDGLAIFLFHGVIEKTIYKVRNYTRKHLDKDYFFKLIKELKSVGCPLSMDDVVRHYSSGKPYPPYSFVVTFDDGFENNYSIAAPILKDLGIPATFYITTDFVDNNHMSWTDKIEYCLEFTNKESLKLPWNINKFTLSNVEDKIVFMDNLRNHVKYDASIDIDMLVSNVYTQCNLDEIEQSNDTLDLKMNWKQIKELRSDDLFSIGGHSHRHKILSFLKTFVLEDDIKTSLDLLKEKAGINTEHYSYPEGLNHCYSNEVINVLKMNDIVCCPTAVDGTNTLDDNLFDLKRIMVI